MKHTFHIPVMGTGFTIDTPLKVARYGISSVVSIVDDNLTENLRRYWCEKTGEHYWPISPGDSDHRARRITAYLDLLDRLVASQIREVRESPFEPGSPVSVYFEMLPDNSPLRAEYFRMLRMPEGAEKRAASARLRGLVTPGSIDVNIMTKADRANSMNGEPLPKEYSDAMAALRGFAKSTLRSSVVFSAGLNLQLYGYIAEFDDFYPDEKGNFKKKVTLKVSDFRSALIQAKNLAKKGVWISEYRVESGLNCGGHAFPTTGLLLGPILAEFRERREELRTSLFALYREALAEKRRPVPQAPPPVRVSAQGGVGTAAEHEFLIRRYGLDSVGWGTPFLLVPEATAVDTDTLARLARAGSADVRLSNSSPLGVPFYVLRDSASEERRKKRIRDGRPGSPCVNKYLAFNTEFGRPLCTASAAYQSRKLEEISSRGLTGLAYAHETAKVLEKACICRDLGDGVLAKYGIDGGTKELSPAVCPGPNIAYFSAITGLREMVGHIYGRGDLLAGARRPHVFINELRLYVDYLKKRVSRVLPETQEKEKEYCREFRANLFAGIEYYHAAAGEALARPGRDTEEFHSDLRALKTELLKLFPAR